MNSFGISWGNKRRVDANWAEQNQSCLVLEFGRLRGRLGASDVQSKPEALQGICAGMEAPPAIDALTSILGLSAFERDVVLLCAGIEMDSPLRWRWQSSPIHTGARWRRWPHSVDIA
jgi:hypothetical protein